MGESIAERFYFAAMLQELRAGSGNDRIARHSRRDAEQGGECVVGSHPRQEVGNSLRVGAEPRLQKDSQMGIGRGPIGKGIANSDTAFGDGVQCRDIRIKVHEARVICGARDSGWAGWAEGLIIVVMRSVADLGSVIWQRYDPIGCNAQWGGKSCAFWGRWSMGQDDGQRPTLWRSFWFSCDPVAWRAVRVVIEDINRVAIEPQRGAVTFQLQAVIAPLW